MYIHTDVLLSSQPLKVELTKKQVSENNGCAYTTRKICNSLTHFQVIFKYIFNNMILYD